MELFVSERAFLTRLAWPGWLAFPNQRGFIGSRSAEVPVETVVNSWTEQQLLAWTADHTVRP